MSQHEAEEHPQQQQSDITSLQQNFSKQQEKISALKELVRKSEAAHGKSTSSAQEKVKNIALRLTNLKSKARSRQNLNASSTSLNDEQFQSQENLHLLQSQCSTSIDAGGGSTTVTPQRPSSARIETPGSEKILLLRKQMEENKIKMAEREHSKREIEHMVTQLKAKFDTTQQHLEHSSELGRSMGDLSALSYSSVKDKVRSATDLASTPFNLDKERIKFLDNRVRLLEKQLEKEKGSSDASKRIKELENRIHELEEGLKEKRTRELVATLNYHDVEESCQIENDHLKTDLEEKSRRIIHLEEVNDILETAKCDLTEKAQTLEDRLQESEKRTTNAEQELEQVKASMDAQRFELVEGVDVDSRVEQELTLQVQQLELKIKELEEKNEELLNENNNLRQDSEKDEEDIDDKTKNLEATIESQRDDIQKYVEKIRSLEEELMEKTIELNVINANFAVLEEKLKVPSRKPLFATTSDVDVASLKDQLEETKKKSKRLEQQLNEFKRMSDLHATVAELTEENEELQQKITELEDEKGQLQLKLVSGEQTTIVTEIEIEKKIEYLEATCQNQTSAIQLLEEQKMDMTENLETTKSELESARVVSEMESIQLEEQVNTNLQKIEELQNENIRLNRTVLDLQEEKNSLTKKIEHYVAENMELLDKIEKLSKSSSSAESIEIVERLTQQDRLEIEAFNKRAEKEEAQSLMAETASGHPEMDQELSDSLIKLKEESSELMHKIELFTTERKEVLEKMENLTAENQEHLRMINQLTDEKAILAQANEEANTERESLKQRFKDANDERETIKKEIKEISAEKIRITAELNSMIKAASLSVPGDSKELLDKCEKSLSKLNLELESYRKANDKNAKFNASKKLSKEAKNAHQQLTELLEKIKNAPPSPIVMPTDDVKLAELQSLIADLRNDLAQASIASEEKDTQITRLNEEIGSLRTMSEEFDRLINDKEMAHEKQIESLTRLRRELESRIETAEVEMKILQELIAEQKQQLIEAYTDSETEIASKIEDLNRRDEEISQLKSEIKTLQASSDQVGQQLSHDLQLEVDKLKEALSINKSLLAEQIDDLTNKQETIDTLNSQIMELYKTMEENANKVIEKEDEIAFVQEKLNVNQMELEKLTKENEENKQVVDKLLIELHSHKGNLERLSQLPALEDDNLKLREENQTLEENLQIAELKSVQLEQKVKDLEHRNKDQLEKLKKYAANLKKKVVQCQEFEVKIKNLEKGALDAEVKEKDPLIEKLELELREKTAQLEKTSHDFEKLQTDTNQQRNHLEQSVLKVQEALDRVQQEVMSLREQLLEKTTQIDELTMALNEKNEDQLQSQVTILQSQLDESKIKVHQLSTRIELYESSKDELRDLQALLNEKNDKIDELNRFLLDADSLQDELMYLREQLIEKNTHIDELNAQTNALKENSNLSNTLLSDLTILREELNSKQKEIEKQNKILDSTEEQLNSLQEDINQKNDQILLLNERLRQMEVSGVQSLELEEDLKQKDAKIEGLTKDFKAKSVMFEKSKAVIKEKNREIQRLNQLLSKQAEEVNIVPTSAPKLEASPQPPSTNLLSEMEELKKENAKLRTESAAERANFQETISKLETLHDGIQAKLQEDMSYIESIELENNNYKEKICRLEECVAIFEDRRSSMERRANLLDAQLQTRQDEHAKAEDELVYRLNMLSEHDDIIGQRLFEAQEENELLSNRLDALKAEHATLVSNYSKLEKEFDAFKEETVNNLDSEKNTIKTQLVALDTEIKRQKSAYEAKLAAKHSEIDELENDLSEQIRTMSDEKRSLLEMLERAKDDISELNNEHVRLNETINSLEQAKADLERESTWIKMQNESLTQDQFELQEMRMQSMQDKTELENLKHQIDTLAQNHEFELNALRTQIAELDSMRMQVGQNQTDDQVFIETENKRLTDLLAEKEAQIESYQRQNLQLQMNALAARQQPVDPFASLTQSDDSAQVAHLSEKCNRLERELSEKLNEIEQLKGEQQQQEIVPPPVAFFGSEQSGLSVFDEIVNVRHIDNLQGAVHSHSINHPEPVGSQRTIEDLQRNVSDLEKHAQDLENKLSHRTAAHEECLLQLEELRRASETRLREYEDRIKELELKEITKTIDSQIIPKNQVPSLDMFFKGAPEESPFENLIIPQVSTEPVVEEIIVPKKAYVCQPSDNVMLDEGWGWGSEEAALEAQHFATTQSSSLLAPQQQFELQLQENHDRIQELELERDRLEQQKQEMQVKSGKLMKKLKEYKAKIDELTSNAAFRKSSSVESSDLDLAIQEEMKAQLKILEEKLSDAKKQNDGQSLEKDHLLKRIDVLTAGNERLTEMKERQDNDVQMYQSRIRELTEKIKNLEEWGSSAEMAPTSPPILSSSPTVTAELEKSKSVLEKQVNELLSEIDDISGDKTELQALLDDEKANVQRAEHTIKGLQEKIILFENSAGAESADKKFQLNEIKLENQNLRSQLNDAQEAVKREKTERLEEINRLATQSEELCGEIAKLQIDSAKAKELEVKLKQISEEKYDLIKEIEALRMELTFIPQPNVSERDQMEQQIVQLTSNLDSIMMQNQDLGREVDRLRVETNRLAFELQSVNEQNEQLTQEVNSLRLQQSFASQNDDRLDIELDSTKQRNSELETELQMLQERNEGLSAEISRIQLTSPIAPKPDNNFLELERLTNELQTASTAITNLSKENEELKQNIDHLTTENKSLFSELEGLRLKSSSSSAALQSFELEEQIQEKDSEIMHLKQRIEDLMREDQTEKLVLEILTKNQEIHMLKLQVKNLEDDKQELEHNLTLQIKQEMNAKRTADAVDATEKLQHLQTELDSMHIEKAQMEEELAVLNNHVMSSLENEEKMKTAVLELDMKNIEIAELRKSLEAIKSQAPSTETDVTSLNAQWETVIEQRCNEIATMWRQHVETREAEFKQITEKFEQEINVLKSSQGDSDDNKISTKDPSSNRDLVQKMQQVLENQEVEIVTLKEQLAIRSAEYARLAAQHDPFKMQSTMSHSSGFSLDGQRRSDTTNSSVVPKSELDLALYMLHQRDMRCEELTLELVNLLEERDTLQLKLSNTLRQVETIKSQANTGFELDLSSLSESPQNQDSPSSTAPTIETDDLNQKLFELHSVSHSKDKRFQEERDQRIRQMEKIQQDVAKMPSEALSDLVGSDLSHSSQSPSSVLLNWLWGKSSGGQS